MFYAMHQRDQCKTTAAKTTSKMMIKLTPGVSRQIKTELRGRP